MHVVQINYLEVANILYNNFKAAYPLHDILMIEDSPEELAKLLVKRIDPEIIDIYMQTEMGQGMLVGMLMVFHLTEIAGVGDFSGNQEEED